MATSWLELLDDVVPADLLKHARAEAARGKNPAEILLEDDSVRAEDVLEAQGRFYNLPVISLPGYDPDLGLIRRVPHDLARRFMLMPLFVLDDQIFVAANDPMDLEGQDYIRQATGLTPTIVLATRGEIEDALNRYYLGKEQSAQAMTSMSESKKQVEAARPTLQIEDQDAPAIKMVNYIFQQGVLMGASDIHLEPFAEEALLRYRVDSILHEFPAPPLHLMRAVVSRVKVLSNLDTSERRLPQDGRASINVQGRQYDLRVSTLPTLHGEGVVIRVLDSSSKSKELDDLGIDPDILKRFDIAIRRPYGMVLVVGPTGSGKTTTLYAALKRIYTRRKKFITLEDPVEYQLDGVTQMHVLSEIGLTFGSGLRAILRQDPDVVMVGEIRDLETAEIATRASLTGHLLFSTLHANTAPLAVTRLIDLGVPAFYVMSSLLAVMGQRLVRLLCPECKVAVTPTPAELEMLGMKVPPALPVYGPQGCAACAGIGYKGRVGIYELLPITSDMRRLKTDELTPSRLAELAVPLGFQSLRDSALKKLLSGLTSIEEVVNITTEE